MTVSRRAGYLDLIRTNREFRLLWGGQIVSLLGDWFNLIATASLVASITESGLAVSGLFVVRMLAPFLVSPLAGVAADRYNRKHLLIITDVIRAVVVLGFLLVREPEHVWLLYALTAAQLGVSGFFFPTRTAILPDIVSRERLGAGNAITSATWSVMLALGAALGGIVSGQWGIAPAFAIDSLTFVGSAIILAQMRYTPPPPPPDTAPGVRAALRQYASGLGYLWRHKDTLAIALHKAGLNLLIVGPYQVIQVALAERIFVIGEGGGTSLGLIFAVTGFGTGIGPILARTFTGDRSRSLRIAIGLGYVITGIGLAISAPLLSFGLVLVGAALRGIGDGTVWVLSTELMLQAVPDDVRGRVFATEFAFLTLGSAAGSAAAGVLIDLPGVGVGGSLWLTAGLSLVPALLWALWHVRRGQGERVTNQVH